MSYKNCSEKLDVFIKKSNGCSKISNKCIGRAGIYCPDLDKCRKESEKLWTTYNNCLDKKHY